MQLPTPNSQHIHIILLKFKVGELQFFKGITNNNAQWQRDD
jgi:hypothetical protein